MPSEIKQMYLDKLVRKPTPKPSFSYKITPTSNLLTPEDPANLINSDELRSLEFQGFVKYSGREAEGIRGNSGERSSSEFTESARRSQSAIFGRDEVLYENQGFTESEEKDKIRLVADKRRLVKLDCTAILDKINQRVGKVFDKRKIPDTRAGPRISTDRFTSPHLETTLGKRPKEKRNVHFDTLGIEESTRRSKSERDEVSYENEPSSDILGIDAVGLDTLGLEPQGVADSTGRSKSSYENELVVPERIDVGEDDEFEMPEFEELTISDEPKPRTKPKTKATQGVAEEAPTSRITKETMLNGRPLLPRLPKPEKIVMRVSPYYMSNRKMYMQKLSELFKNYNREIADESGNASCDRQSSEEFQLLIHQRIVRDYLNIYTPYRGLLLYHGLGSGKTCTSIALAEGMKTHRKIFVMTPASLKMNFFSELKKCGDSMYKKKQYWEFVSTQGQPQNVGILSDALSLPPDFILKHKGAWLMDITKTASNYGELTGEDQQVLDAQLNAMIRSKYVDINYNGFNDNRFKKLTKDETINPFNHSVVLIDEAHNFVSRISNKLKAPKSVSYKLYQLLMDAEDVRIIFMTGTPMINYPNELGILYNMLRGRIRTWTFTITENQRLIKDHIVDMFDRDGLNTYDYIDYSNGKLEITRNPFGFVNAGKETRTQKETKKRGGSRRKTTKAITILRDIVSPENGGFATSYRLRNSLKTCQTYYPGKGTRKNIKDLEIPGFTESEGRSKSAIFGRDEVSYENKETPETKQAEFIEKDDVSSENNVEVPEEINAHVEEQVERELLEYANNMGDPHKGGATFGKGGATFGKGGDPIASDKYTGVYLNEQGNISDATFISEVKRILQRNNIVIHPQVEMKSYTALPDDAEGFLQMFVEDSTLTVKNVNLFKKRILGLTSYFRSAQESLLPAFEKTDHDEIYHIVPIEMSDYQIKNYFRIRADEAKKEKNQRIVQASSKELYNTASSYRIFSRSACNFVFPPDIPRPLPNPATKKVSEEQLDNIADANTEDMYIDENAAAPIEDQEYNERIHQVIAQLSAPVEPTGESPYVSREGLARLSPKFLRILENIESVEHKGLHLLYSNFRSLEGIGIFKLVLEANGFAEFKLQRNGDIWEIKETDPDMSKPRFVLYTGTETNDEKEIIRNIYNSQWELVPASIVAKLREKSENNYYGEVVKLIMITASGAEGINLANTRYVHIMEPYWHMVRVDQVIGRARRICSHKNLPEELRTVKVFLYVSVFSEMQKVNRDYKELMLKDVSRQFQKPITTDESLYDIALLKNNINSQLLKSIKETAMDCRLYKKGNASEDLVCYGEGVSMDTTEFGIFPSIDEDRVVREDINVRKTTRKVSKFTEKGKNGAPDKVYARFQSSNNLYDWDAYDNSKQEILVATYDPVAKRIRPL